VRACARLASSGLLCGNLGTCENGLVAVCPLILIDHDAPYGRLSCSPLKAVAGAYDSSRLEHVRACTSALEKRAGRAGLDKSSRRWRRDRTSSGSARSGSANPERISSGEPSRRPKWLVISRLQQRGCAAAHPIYSGRALSGTICHSHEELRSSFIFIIAVSVPGCSSEAGRVAPRGAPPRASARVRADKHLNIYETFIGGRRAWRGHRCRCSASTFRAISAPAVTRRPSDIAVHRRRRRRRRLAPPPTTFFHLRATSMFTIARDVRTNALFFRYFSVRRR